MINEYRVNKALDQASNFDQALARLERIGVKGRDALICIDRYARAKLDAETATVTPSEEKCRVDTIR